MYRTTAREIAMQLGYAAVVSRTDPEELMNLFFRPENYETLTDEDPVYSEFPDEAQMKYIHEIITGVCGQREALDDLIGKYAVNWRTDRISRLAMAILRTAIFEILHYPDVPYRAAANEAVELAKTYEGVDTAKFINGILASVIQNERHEQP